MSEAIATDPIPYEKFRTGLTYCDVYYMLWNRPHKMRNGVLGFWRELKLKMYAEYLYQCGATENPDGIQAADRGEISGDI